MVEKFRKLGLKEEFLQAIGELGFKEPTEIQEKTIPLALAGKDIIGGSATGSGKTLAFGAGILENVEKGKGLQSLILVPTRELAEQVSKSLISFARFKHLRISSIYGGVSILPQFRELLEAEIVVGTPGRILDHLARDTINLNKVKFLVLDEADRMLDMGFLDDVEKIIKKCPEKRQTFLFSATISEEITRLSERYMHSPVEIAVDNQVDPSKLEQVFYDVRSYEKFSLLVHLLKEENSALVMVFTNTKHNADYIARNLGKVGIDAMALHGNLSQNQRTRVLEHFHKSQKFVLVCTDVAARGLDIKNVSHVYNYDSPKNSTDYVHRIGRTARAGKEGKAITILGEQDYDNFRNVQRNPDLYIKKIEAPEFERIQMSLEHRERRFSGGNRNFGNNRFGAQRRVFHRDRGGRHSGGYGGGEREEKRGDNGHFRRKSSFRDRSRRFSHVKRSDW
jgi:ATP-dependent RNA helicase DeaD